MAQPGHARAVMESSDLLPFCSQLPKRKEGETIIIIIINFSAEDFREVTAGLVCR